MEIRKGKKGFFAIKIDLEKAYDRMNIEEFTIISDSRLVVQGINGENTLLDIYTNQCYQCRQIIGATTTVQWSRDKIKEVDAISRAVRKARIRKDIIIPFNEPLVCNITDPIPF